MTMGSKVAASLSLLALLSVLLSGSALAQEIPRLDGPVTDRTGARVLSGSASRVEDAAKRLASERGVDLFVLFVDSTSPRTMEDYAREAFRVSSLGDNDALFVVAVRDRAYFLHTDRVARVSPPVALQIRTQQIEPRLRDNDWAGASVAAADGLRAALGGAPAPTAPGQQPSAPSVPSGGVDLSGIIGIVLLAVGAFWLIGRMGARGGIPGERRAESKEERDRRTGELSRQANELLIKTDEALRDAEQELGFAEAQFGPAEVGPYRAAVRGAAEEMKAAFAVRQKLDDAIPEDPPTREGMLREILDRAGRASKLLEEQRARIDRLRDIERRAPEILAEMPSRIDALEARLPQAEATLAALREREGAKAGALRGNIVEAQKRLAFARAQIESARTPGASGEQRSAGQIARAAEGALAEAQRLLDAIDNLQRSLDEAAAARARDAETLVITLREAEVSIARAEDFIATRRGGVGRTARTRLAQAQEHYDSARSMAASDPSAALEAAKRADALADAAYERAQDDFDDFDHGGIGGAGRRRRGGGGMWIPPIIIGGGWGGGGGGRQGGGFGGTPWGGWGGGSSGGGGFGGGSSGGGRF